MLEGDDRREDRHLRRAAEDLGAVDDVPPHDHELVVGQLVGLVEDLLRRADLADVVHQRRQAELAQQPAVDPERARLPHRQDRHVHHVGERVVVVVAHRRQRHERGAVLRDGVGEPVDRLQRRGRVRHALRSAALSHADFRDRHGVRVQLADRGHVARRCRPLLPSSAVMRPTRMCGNDQRRSADRSFAAERGDGVHEARATSSCRDARARTRSARSCCPSSRLISSAIAALALGIGVSATTRSLPTMPTAIEGCCWCSGFSAASSPSMLRADERMVGRVELRGADAGGEPPQQLVVQRGSRSRSVRIIACPSRHVRAAASSARAARAHAARAAAATRRAARRRPAACRSSAAPRPRRRASRRVRSGAHQSPCCSASFSASTASGPPNEPSARSRRRRPAGTLLAIEVADQVAEQRRRRARRASDAAR